MDPQATWALLLDAYSDHDGDRVDEHALKLLHWLESGGSSPQTASHWQLRPPANRLIAMATCRLTLEQSEKGGRP